jgi:acyl-CoA thioesterase FadM
MARIKLNMPEKIIFSTKIKVRISDVNYGGHLGNDSLISLIHDARVEFLKSFGWSEIDLAGVSLIQSELAGNYKGEAFQGDILNFEIAVGDISNKGFELYFQAKNETGDLICIAKTGLLCFDYQAKKIVNLPEVVKEKWS